MQKFFRALFRSTQIETKERERERERERRGVETRNGFRISRFMTIDVSDDDLATRYICNPDKRGTVLTRNFAGTIARIISFQILPDEIFVPCEI